MLELLTTCLIKLKVTDLCEKCDGCGLLNLIIGDVGCDACESTGVKSDR
jgi:hypothetical protein